MWKLSLDETQKKVIAQLAGSREAWHTAAAYDPERSLNPPAVGLKNGALLREHVPHAAHASWKMPPRRPSPVDIVVAGNAGRQEQFVPLRMARMSASPFTFLRGAAAVMAWDLSHTPVSGIQVLIDGDAHINNFTSRRRRCALTIRVCASSPASALSRPSAIPWSATPRSTAGRTT